MASSHQCEACTEHRLSEVPESESDDKEKEERVERVRRAQWLRAALLGANDGLLSTTALMLGVAAAREDRWFMILSGFAGAVAGACSMAVGEFVSVSMQRDIEKMVSLQNCEGPKPADQAKKAVGTPTGAPSSPSATPNHITISMCQLRSPATNAIGEELNLKRANKEPGEEPSPQRTPARRLSTMSPGRSPMMRVIAEDSNSHKGLPPPAAEGIEVLPNPFKAACASAVAFMCGSHVPLLSIMFLTENEARIVVLLLVASITLVVFGGVGAYLGGASPRISAIKVLIGGWIAMAITYALLKPFDNDDKR